MKTFEPTISTDHKTAATNLFAYIETLPVYGKQKTVLCDLITETCLTAQEDGFRTAQKLYKILYPLD